MTVILTFEDESVKTKYTARVRHWTEADREQHEKMGSHQGLGAVRRPACCPCGADLNWHARPNNRLQRTALRAAAEPEHWVSIPGGNDQERVGR
jgi:hypothetical protein